MLVGLDIFIEQSEKTLGIVLHVFYHGRLLQSGSHVIMKHSTKEGQIVCPY